MATAFAERRKETCLESFPSGLKPSAQRAKHKEFFYIKIMVEPLLSGIVLGLVPITIIGLFVTAYLQYKRGDRLL